MLLPEILSFLLPNTSHVMVFIILLPPLIWSLVHLQLHLTAFQSCLALRAQLNQAWDEDGFLSFKNHIFSIWPPSPEIAGTHCSPLAAFYGVLL